MFVNTIKNLLFYCLLIALKSFLNTVVFFLNEILKKKLRQKPPRVRVELGAFGSVVGALTIELLGNISTMEYLININIENMLYGLW